MVSLSKITKIIIVFVCLCFLTLNGYCYDQRYDYLKDLTKENYDPKKLTRDEMDYMKKIILGSTLEVLPVEYVRRILEKKYISLEELIFDFQYYKFWTIKPVKRQIYEDWPVTFYNLVRDDISKIVACVVYLDNFDTYSIMGIEDQFFIERYNEIVQVDIKTQKQALNYARNFSVLTHPFSKIIDKELKGKKAYSNIQSFPSPKVLFASNEYYLFEIHVLAKNGIRLPFYVKKTVILVTNTGKVACLTCLHKEDI